MATPKLFTPLKVGRYHLQHRVVMAPLTRIRAQPDGVPTPLMAEYYSQRSSQGGLIVAEAAQISQEGQGMYNTPGIYTQEHVEGWKPITDAVHKKGGVIFLQLWHMGRQSHSTFQPNGGLPVAPSAVPIKATSRGYTKSGERVPYEKPRALETSEIPRIVADYAHAARMAMEAGFDGVEIHGANSYLIDQFLHDSTNERTDQYGGSISNRVRFLLEVTEAVVGVCGSDRVGLRLSPPVFLDDSNKDALFTHAIKEVNRFNLAYLHLVDPMGYARFGLLPPEPVRHLTAGFFRPFYDGVIIECGGIDRQQGIELVDRGDSDAIAYGVPFMSNPDLPYRLIHDLPLAPPAHPSTYYGVGAKYYSDYPSYLQLKGADEGKEQAGVKDNGTTTATAA